MAIPKPRRNTKGRKLQRESVDSDTQKKITDSVLQPPENAFPRGTIEYMITIKLAIVV